ncbi:GDSL-type esterase/lipase family protein [uncultured Ruminococcus sp.]|uniref:GDSL-type esterase/lipase family protein n=1 Tax=uncultured Ruminococcus sp. TaxID=165186 RepID=UPI002609AFB4|nr:GDSL-type esterase/lipase family protein [uncultured Ruminococcus sp.]
MKTVFCFGDSNTYGLNPRDKSRFDDATRWTGLLDQKLRPHGFRVAEEGLCGRTTIFPDRTRPNRCGADVLPFLLESHAPAEYAIVMLGTNDCKTCFHATAAQIAGGMRRLVQQIKAAGISRILLISPIHLAHGVGEVGFDPEFNEASVALSRELKGAYAKAAAEEGCLFLAASDVSLPSKSDREHMDETGHKALAEAVFQVLLRDFSE